MNTELTEASPQVFAPQWTTAGPAETAVLDVDIRGAQPFAWVRGEIDILSAPWLLEELERLMQRHGARLVLDLSGVTFMDCSGINMLLAARRRAQFKGGLLRVISPSASVRRVISLAGL